jgi:environmental stress-induced protein Ves
MLVVPPLLCDARNPGTICTMIVLPQADYVAVPWKNGGGLTREILKVPPDATAFDWRLSLATIETPGPFSAFDGYDRTLVLMQGAGVELDFGSQGRAVLQAPGQLAAFDGGWATSCTLIDGPSSDLNLIVSKARAESRVRLIKVATPELIYTAGWEETLICCVTGAAQIEDAAGRIIMLSGADVARCTPEDGVLTCAPDGVAPALLFVAALRHPGNSGRKPIFAT